MSEGQCDLVLLSQILNIHNHQVLALLGESDFRRYLTADELGQLANSLNFPELEQDLQFFVNATRQQGLERQKILREKYSHLGLQRHIFPLPLPSDLEEDTEQFGVSPATTNAQRIVAPNARKLGIIWNFNTEQQRGWLLPVEMAPDFAKDRITDNTLPFSQKTEGADYQKWELVSYRHKQDKASRIHHQFAGVISWFNGEYGGLNSRFGKHVIQRKTSRNTDLVAGQVVQFEAIYDNGLNRYSAVNCQALASLTELPDESEQVATLDYFLFENPSAGTTSLNSLTVPVDTITALIRYRLSLAFPSKNSEDIASHVIPPWDDLAASIACAVSERSEWATTTRPIFDLIERLTRLLPDWIADETNQQALSEWCLWHPLQKIQSINREEDIDFLLSTYQALQKIWPQTRCPDWHIQRLQTNLKQWCDNLILTDAAEEKQALHRIWAARAVLPTTPEPFEKSLQLSPEYQLTKWINQVDGISLPVPENPAELATLLEQIPADKTARALIELPTSELIAAFPLLSVPTLRILGQLPLRTVVADDLLERQLKLFEPLAFDLETDMDGGYIREAYFQIGEQCSGHLTVDDGNSQATFYESFQQAVGKAVFVMGHNIRAFDMPILSRQGIAFGPLPVWDTLEMEALLSPLSTSFALVTDHTARADTEKTVALFRNQFRRLTVNWGECAELLWQILPPPIAAWVDDFYTTCGKALTLPNPEIQKSFFHQPIPQTLLVDIRSLPDDKPTLVVAPRFVWPRLVGLPDLQFGQSVAIQPDADAEPDYYLLILDADKITSVIRKTVVRQLVLAYTEACHRARIAAMVAGLPAWTLRQLLDELSDITVICRPAAQLPSEPMPGSCFVTDELSFFRLNGSAHADWHIHYVERELSAITFKHRLGQVNIHNQADFFSQSTLWTKLVGGNRYAPLPTQFLKTIPNLESPGSRLTNFWLEKNDAAVFTVWANATQPDVFDTLVADEKTVGNDGQVTEKKTRFTLVYSKSNSGLFYRLNPETIYRDAYWTGQFFLFQQLRSDKPLVWLIQHQHEVGQLSAWLKQAGYHTPPTEGTLRRRIEMLHQSTHRKRVLVATLDSLTKLVDANTQEPLSVVIDSLPLSELAMMMGRPTKSNAHETLIDDALTTDDDAESEPETDDADNGATRETAISRTQNRLPGDYTLRLAAPLLRYYRQLLRTNHTDNELQLLDVRINDHPDLASRLSVARIALPLWSDDNDYQRLQEQIAQYIPSPKPVEFSPTDLEKAQRTIERVFLGQNGQDEELRLRDNQQPYFDRIIQAKDDLVVSLPTGGGKSVLFQGPALYRGSLSNRLTVVITPLRALMEDQVSKLESLGFFGCVEFINQQSDDIPGIYRRIAGGEITLVYVTPERFRSRSFDRALRMRIQKDGGLEYCVFDEAHCISQWGGEFRPDYLWVASLMNKLKKANGNFPALFFSATVSEQIYNDLSDIFV